MLALPAGSAPALSIDDIDVADDVQLWDSNSVLGHVDYVYSNSFNSFNSYVRYVTVNPAGQTFPKRQIPLQRLPLSLRFAGTESITCHLCLSIRGDTKVCLACGS